MISKEEAILKYLAMYPERLVNEVFDMPGCWIISGKDKETGEELDVRPDSIRKDDGQMEGYFPPDHTPVSESH